MRLGKENSIAVIATLILIVGILSNLYVHANEYSTEKWDIKIDGKGFSKEEIFTKYRLITIQNSLTKKNYTGVSLEDLIESIGISNPESHSYTIIGSDGYKKTVKWTNMENGILTSEMKVVFRSLPKAYMVKNVVDIEVD